MPKAQHPKAASFLRQGLFAGVVTFTELETRIVTLPDNQSRGDAFEVFAEAYLATQRKHDATNVWPLTAVPTQILQTLGLATKDYGVDGVFKTLLGNFNAYQVKFRTNRPALTWRELSTFMGLADSPQIRSRVLLTNCDELPSVLNERQGFFCIRGSDLDRLEADDFRAIEAWLADAAFVAPKKQPQPHQAEALNALLPALEIHDRVSAIMACGTGKTLVALWIAERRNASRILVLVPSLALLRQVLHEWLRESSLPSLAYLCVCSDPTVKDGLDSIATAQSDLDFQVSTDAANVRDFLDAPFTGTKVVFSTYQSAKVVGEALQSGEAFDLAVFDEAHKTAGREGRNYAFALEDTNLPIRKRLFLTATPRHYNPQKQDGEGDAQLVFSMDRPDVYGPQAYRLTFAEAARRGIICGYKVIISVITSETVTNELLSRGDMLVNGDAVRARQVANQIALRDAIEKYGTSKVFTFHKTVASAASFVADGSEGIRTHLAEFETFHVNGTMPTARREREMREFRAAARAVISNARCLTEGVDVPAVDMVAFLSPRRSQVDIVQATGRAMRRSPGKTTGYVLVPLYVEQAADESVEAAVSRSAFDEVWDVLHSLQEQDDVLAELIRHMGEQKGRGKGFDDSEFADRVDITGIQIGIEALRSAVATRCFERLFSSWDTYFGKLAAFRERFGHCNVKTAWAEDISFASWVTAQRFRRKKGALSDEQIERLDSLGFVWNWQKQSADENWMGFFQKLKLFKERFGHCNVKTAWEEDISLASWVTAQRSRRNKGALSDEQIERLDSLEFVWDWQKQKSQETWMKWYRELETYTREHGDPHVPGTHSNTKLASWVWIQRQRRKGIYKTKKTVDLMAAEQVSLLNKLGFRWGAGGATRGQWSAMLERLTLFKEEHGHCEALSVADGDNKLIVWINTQRLRQARGKMDTERKMRLDALGFSWSGKILDLKWNGMHERLKNYHTQHGNADIPYGWKEDQKLARWVNTQRQRRKNDRITEDQVRLLDELGFTWHHERGSWEDRLAEVAAFVTKHGHCEIPLNHPENPKLGRFVNNTRTQWNGGQLSDDRITKLDALGFLWASSRKTILAADGISADWQARFEQLKAYKERFGDCSVPVKWNENPQLGTWVSNQRQERKSGTLHPERQRLLDEIGFDWRSERGKEAWATRFEQLKAYKERFGDCSVPRKWQENPLLGVWVESQRSRLKRGTFEPERQRQLDEIGFDWRSESRKEAWATRFEQLKAYEERFGDCRVPVKWQENPQLGGWVATQRHRLKSGILSPEKSKLLVELGF
jgi:superfamily II DNA or RNA helicase